MVLGFLDVVPDKLVCKPDGLPDRQIGVLAGWMMTNRKPLTTLLAHHGLHDHSVWSALFILAHALGCST